MADASNTEGNQTETGAADSFTEAQQAFINDTMSKRINEVKSKYDSIIKDMETRHRKELERSRLDDEARAKAEMDETLAELTKRAEKAERSLRIAQAERDLEAVGLSRDLAEIVLGADDEATSRAIKALDKASSERANALFADRVRTGAPDAPETAPTSHEALKEMMRQAAGLPPVKGGL